MRAFAVVSGSMTPNIPVGSLVIDVPCEIEDAKEGDVVTFVLNENLDVATHRIVDINIDEGTVTTRGDANNVNDQPTLWANVVGKVVVSIPYLGYAFFWINTMSGRIIAVTVVVVIILLMALVDTLRKPKPVANQDEEKSEDSPDNLPADTSDHKPFEKPETESDAVSEKETDSAIDESRTEDSQS